MFLHTTYRAIEKLQVNAPSVPGVEDILTPEALEFIGALETEFGPQRRVLLKQRRVRQAELDAGALPDFSPATKGIRESAWRAAPIPRDLLDRRVEITGPPERKMLINALNSGANVYMADFEDAMSPSWSNLLLGQKNLCDAVDGSISYTSPDGKQYRLSDRVATLMVRPRGWHLDEKHIVIDKRPISASLFDFGLFFFHNAKKLLEKGTGPYFYLPKLESHAEAKLWNGVFVMAQEMLGIPRGTIRATVLIETILAAFEMEEILYALREHSAGLNCGRWDYIFSVIKKFRNRPEFIFPDRNSVTMTAHFLRSYSRLLIQTCHRRGAHAIGGMAAYIPVKSDPEANERAIQKVRGDKEREVADGHDGTWVAHPGLVPIAKAVFDAHMPGPNQLQEIREDVHVTADDLLTVPQGVITEEGVRTNIRIALQYLEAWLGGNGCVPLNNLMEDTATAEISRAQLWQWLHHPNAVQADGRPISEENYRNMLQEEIANVQGKRNGGQGCSKNLHDAKLLVNKLVLKKHFEEFLTHTAYRYID